MWEAPEPAHGGVPHLQNRPRTDHHGTSPPEELRSEGYFYIEADQEGNLSVGMWQMVADMGNRNSVVDVDKEVQRAGWNGQGGSKVEIPEVLRLVDSRTPFAFARTYRGAMEGWLAL